MKAKGHLQTYNHFSLVVKDAGLCHQAWEKAFQVSIPTGYQSNEKLPDDLSGLFYNTPTYRGLPWPEPKSYGVEQPLLAPFYQPGPRMIEAKAAGTMPSLTDYYERFGNGIQYFGIVEGENRDPFLDELKEVYGVEKLEEMFYDPMPGDFCVVETEKLLGFNLCVKKDGAINGEIHETLPPVKEATIVVESLERAIRDWSDVFDIVTPQIQTVKETALLRGEEKEISFRFATIHETPFPLHLVEAKTMSPFYEFVEKQGFGIHHITFESERNPRKFAANMKEALNIDPLAEYDLEGQHYIVFDSVDQMGARIAVSC